MVAKFKRQIRPTPAEIKHTWRKFRSATDFLPFDIDPEVKPSITILRANTTTVEITSDTLQRTGTTLNFHLSSLVAFGVLLLFSVSLMHHTQDLKLIFLIFAIPLSYLTSFGLSYFLGIRFHYRRSTVRFNRITRQVFFAPHIRTADSMWIMNWDEICAVDYYRGKGQGYLYLVGHPANLGITELVKIPIIGAHIGYHNASSWLWLHRYMTGDSQLPAPTIEYPPQTWRDVLLKYGGQWVLTSFTDPKRRRWLPLTIWADLFIVLLFMPIMALPQLIILTYPEPKFPAENDKLCGFTDKAQSNT
ncbi:DUF6708 domain-containing protein [Pseudomonas sp. R5(2019)]|uniref:DUF6708 domain-containing protein n=1 Tax=Pseudomonas sp. R5(2019) TaxID=2697566 RepID=UPI0014136F8E|nr:DUF6708 domain-containing protein [Pseudomonas sp. R5(2019)]NBA94909.1 hypothetical protein [Pseudomonas sp. R5(2019)]